VNIMNKIWSGLKWLGGRLWANLIGFLAILWPTAWPRAKKALVALIGTSATVWLAKNNIPLPVEDLDLIVNTALDTLAGPLTAFLVYRVPNAPAPQTVASNDRVARALEMVG
jgi:hypothetical protein